MANAMGKNIVCRLAPSPTGLAHLGNAWSFLICWLAGRARKGKVFLRIDDIDPDRSRQEYVEAMLADLSWLGLDWDGEIIRQSGRTELYAEAMRNLERRGLVFACFCTRKELRSIAGAPHGEDGGFAYPGTCLKLHPADAARLIKGGRAHATRLQCPSEPIEFCDLVYGRQVFRLEEYGGHFAIQRSDGVWAYQLANVVDDALMGVNLVIRGRDLLSSTPRQLILQKYLGYPQPQYAHLPLLLDAAGGRLAKRHSSLSLAALRETGVTPEEIVGELARLARINPSGKKGKPGDFLYDFDLRKLPGEDIAGVGELWTRI